MPASVDFPARPSGADEEHRRQEEEQDRRQDACWIDHPQDGEHEGDDEHEERPGEEDRLKYPARRSCSHGATRDHGEMNITS